MDINCFKYLELDEKEMQKQDDEQRKEIQALLTTEFYNLELEDDDEDINNEGLPSSTEEITESIIDDSCYAKDDQPNQSPIVQGSAVPWLHQPLAGYYTTQQAHNINMINYTQPQSNNNCHRDDDSSINWEISLHGEMGIPISRSTNQFYTDKRSYMATSNIPPQHPPHFHNKDQESQLKTPVPQLKKILRDVAVECIPINQRELDNLELLYSARGKRIEQLQIDLDSEREKRLRETRVLTHQVTLMESEQRNESNLLKSYKMELIELREELSEKERTVQDQSKQLADFEVNVSKLQTMVASKSGLVESLNQQLVELTTRTTMARNEKKHEDLLECINNQFDTDSQRFQADISRLSERVNEKVREIERLQLLLDEQARYFQSQKKMWSEERQQLDDQLNEEKSCRQKLESSTSQHKITQLQRQISELCLGKSMVEDMNIYLHEEVQEYVNQLEVYEKSLSVLESKLSIDEGVKDVNRVSVRTTSCPMLTTLPNIDAVNGGTDCISMIRKELFSLTSRTHSLTNRLLDVRKDNLELKSYVKKLQQTIDDQNEVLFVLEEKFAKTEDRLLKIQSGQETDIEKQLRNSVQSLEVVRDSLELQCKTLQAQLKQANISMEEMDIAHKTLEKDFSEFKDLLEEDKSCSIEEVKRACNNHFENLRQQLEISWMGEKESLLMHGKRLQEELQNELSEALKEVDRVKNLYIVLSQRQTNEDSDRTNWNEWLSKKLDDQKRSLNQQFQYDLQSKLIEVNDQHDLMVQKLRSQLERPKSTEDRSEGTEVNLRDIGMQAEGDVIDEYSQTNVTLHDTSVQTTEICCGKENMEALHARNDWLQSSVDSLQIQLHNVHSRDKPTTTPQEGSHNSASFPKIMRSCSPQPVQSSFTPLMHNQKAPPSNFKMLFQSLKEDLVTKLTDLSRSTQFEDNLLRRSQMATSSISPLGPANVVKEQLLSYVLQMQARAASTIQQELRTSQSHTRIALLRQLRQILPLTLSVDGQIMNINPDKMKVLIDKVSLILERLQTDNIASGNVSPSPSRQAQSPVATYFSATSTPKNSQTINHNMEDLHSDVTSPFSDSSFERNPFKSAPHQPEVSPTSFNAKNIRSQCEQLQDEIAKLSGQLQKTKTHYGPITVRPLSLFANVDQNWLCDSQTSETA